MVHQTVQGNMTQGAEKSAHSHGSLGNLGLHKPRQLVVSDFLVPPPQKLVANAGCNKQHEACNDQCAKNRVGRAVKLGRAGQHADTRLNVHGNLSDAEGDHAEVSVEPGLSNERGTHVEWRKWQISLPVPFN